MNRSTDRILTTHPGSLIRTREIIEGWKARTLDKPYDKEAHRRAIRRDTIDIVRQQVETGIDVPNDGEFGRPGFTLYIHERIGGLERIVVKPGEKNPLDGNAHLQEKDLFPGFTAQYEKYERFMWMLPEVDMTEMVNIRARSEIHRLVSPLFHIDTEVQRDIANMKAALEGLDVSDAFITAVSPTTDRKDSGILDFYDSYEAYQYAIADILHEEYVAITDAGFILQLDRPAQNPILHLDLDDDVTRDKLLDAAVELVNYSLRGIPEDRVRSAWVGGSGNRTHTTDVPLEKTVKAMLRMNVGAYGIEAASPRHQHEVRIWEDLKLPDGKILIPGVISQSTNIVEHPDTVAWRIKNFADLVGRENVMAGVDCGFSQDWDTIRAHPEVQWAKFKSLVDGAAIASKELWRK